VSSSPDHILEQLEQIRGRREHLLHGSRAVRIRLSAFCAVEQNGNNGERPNGWGRHQRTATGSIFRLQRAGIREDVGELLGEARTNRIELGEQRLPLSDQGVIFATSSRENCDLVAICKKRRLGRSPDGPYDNATTGRVCRRAQISSRRFRRVIATVRTWARAAREVECRMLKPNDAPALQRR